MADIKAILKQAEQLTSAAIDASSEIEGQALTSVRSSSDRKSRSIHLYAVSPLLVKIKDSGDFHQTERSKAVELLKPSPDRDSRAHDILMFLCGLVRSYSSKDRLTLSTQEEQALRRLENETGAVFNYGSLRLSSREDGSKKIPSTFPGIREGFSINPAELLDEDLLKRLILLLNAAKSFNENPSKESAQALIENSALLDDQELSSLKREYAIDRIANKLSYNDYEANKEYIFELTLKLFLENQSSEVIDILKCFADSYSPQKARKKQTCTQETCTRFADFLDYVSENRRMYAFVKKLNQQHCVANNWRDNNHKAYKLLMENGVEFEKSEEISGTRFATLKDSIEKFKATS